MVTSKILNPKKIVENKREWRNIGFEADMLIIFKFLKLSPVGGS